jgi:hypothetical protein
MPKEEGFTLKVLQNPLPTGVARASCPCFMGGTPMPRGVLQEPLLIETTKPQGKPMCFGVLRANCISARKCACKSNTLGV